MKYFFLSFIFCFSNLGGNVSTAQNDNKFESILLKQNSQIELGKIKWVRNYESALALAEKVNKPILIFFQEAPGCHTCTSYGETVLSHPLIVDAIETEFIPLAIYNTKKGAAELVLQLFNEPTWNKPVVRFINSDEIQLSPSLANDYSAGGLVNSMIFALQKANKNTPEYLSYLAEELNAQSTKEAYISMHCFWSGEASLGKQTGVIDTEAGFMSGQEVVRVVYDTKSTNWGKVISTSRKDGCANKVLSDDKAIKRATVAALGPTALDDESLFRADKAAKHYLSKQMLRFVPMTNTQAARINAALSDSSFSETMLSKRQNILLSFIKSNPELKWESRRGDDFLSAWQESMDILAR